MKQPAASSGVPELRHETLAKGVTQQIFIGGHL